MIPVLRGRGVRAPVKWSLIQEGEEGGGRDSSFPRPPPLHPRPLNSSLSFPLHSPPPLPSAYLGYIPSLPSRISRTRHFRFSTKMAPFRKKRVKEVIHPHSSLALFPPSCRRIRMFCKLRPIPPPIDPDANDHFVRVLLPRKRCIPDTNCCTMRTDQT